MNIKVLGAHNCETQSTKFVSLLIDDILAMDAGGLTSTLSLAAQLRLKAILLTHQHYDHIRDIPALAMNLYLHYATINIYSTQAVCEVLTTYLLNGKFYPDFLEEPKQNPTIRFNRVEPYQRQQIEGYSILPTKSNHPVPTVGYQVTSPEGQTVFYTGDSGPSLSDCWQHVSPQLLIIEVTVSNKHRGFAKGKHFTPALLKEELVNFQELKGYLPQTVLVHMFPNLEEEIESEVASVAEALNHPISLAYEGMQIDL
jgi:ribonuclease BN (tRNA processing enzyme)